MKKLCYVATIPAAVHAFLRGHIQSAAEHYQITVVCNATDAYLLEDLPAQIIILPIKRNISIWHDWSVLMKLAALFYRQEFDLVHSIMPKTGLLAMGAAWLCGTPLRIHTFTGQVWAAKKGWRRKILKYFDSLIIGFASHILTDSPTQRDFIVAENLLSKYDITVIGQHGSICGVDLDRFRPDPVVRQQIRQELTIDDDQIMILYMGRLNRDKGILDLATAFNRLLSEHQLNVVWVCVGAEENITYHQLQMLCAENAEHLRLVHYSTKPEHYMAAADIFCLPSYREGFGQVIIEAAATEVPSVATGIYGIIDAVAETQTGLLYPAGDIDALTRCLLKLATHGDLRQLMGKTARERTARLFSSHQITKEMLAYYQRIISRYFHND